MTGVAPAPPVLGALPLRPEWPVIVSVGAALALTSLMYVVLRGDEIPLVFAHLLVLLLAAGAAYLLDDRSAQVTAVVPRSLVRRRLAVVARGLLVAAVGWGLVVLLLEWRSPGLPAAALTWEAMGLFGLAAAAAAVVARRGETEPGNLVATTLGLLFVALLVTGPLMKVTVLADSGDSSGHPAWWAGVVLASMATLVVASREGAGIRSSGRTRSG